MNFDWIVPGINVAICPVVIGHIPGWAQENSTCMHKFAEREVGDQHRNEKQVDKKDSSYTRWYGGAEAHQTCDQLFDAGDINPDEIAHEDAGTSQGDDQKEREIVGGERNVTELRQPMLWPS